ncbi:MAG: antitoxin [Solirubrobacteraceae bacterium]
MGLSDRLKQFGDKAKESAVEHREEISNAVETMGGLADKRTGGKYTDKIAQAASKTEAAVDRFAGGDDASSEGQTAGTADAPVTEPAPAPPGGDEATGRS